MKRGSIKPAADTKEEMLFDNWFDPIEPDLRTKVEIAPKQIPTKIATAPYTLYLIFFGVYWFGWWALIPYIISGVSITSNGEIL